MRCSLDLLAKGVSLRWLNFVLPLYFATSLPVCKAWEHEDNHPILTRFPVTQESPITPVVSIDTDFGAGFYEQSLIEKRQPLLESQQLGLVSHVDSTDQQFSTSSIMLDRESGLNLSGRIHLDYWGFPASSPGVNAFETGDPNLSLQDRFGFRRIRIGASGELPRGILYELELEFASPKNVQFRDVFIGWNHMPVVQTLLVGNQKRPYGLDHLNSSNDNVFMERPFVVEAFNQDARRLGVCSYGVSEDLAWNWRYGLFNQRLIQDEGRYISNHLQGQIAGRLARTIWLGGDTEGSDYVHLAVAGTWADTDPGALTENFAGSGVSEAHFRTRPEAGTVSRWLDTGVIAGGDDYTLLGFEGVVNLGSLHLGGEYQNVWLERTALESLEFQGGYIYVSYFLTGEYLPWDAKLGIVDAVDPLRSFSLVKGDTPRGLGAWQLALRWSYGDCADGDIEGGAGESITAGLNWYWNPNARMQLNYIYGEIEGNGFNTSAGSPPDGDYQIMGTRIMVHY